VPKHEIMIRATNEVDVLALEVRCSCGEFLLDRAGPPQASLVEITGLIAAHYAFVAHPEKSNGHKAGRM
jgi:hypothetical protein